MSTFQQYLNPASEPDPETGRCYQCGGPFPLWRDRSGAISFDLCPRCDGEAPVTRDRLAALGFADPREVSR